MNDLSEQLDKISQLTNSMQLAAAEQDWETVSLLERERLTKLEQLFSQALTEQESKKVRAAVQEVISIDESILQSAEQARNGVHIQAKQLLLEKRAFEEYAKNR